MTASMEDHLQGPLAPALQKVAPEAFAAHVKRLGVVNAWADPNFKDAVAATGRKQLVMAHRRGCSPPTRCRVIACKTPLRVFDRYMRGVQDKRAASHHWAGRPVALATSR